MTTKKATSKSKPAKATKERAVLVTTSHRGVFFGYSAKTDGDTIKLRDGRSVLYWSAACKGFMGLAANGPVADCRVGPAANIEVRNITSVTEVTDHAVKAFEVAPWR